MPVHPLDARGRPVGPPKDRDGRVAAPAPGEPPAEEVRFSELIPMIHDWVQRSFLPQQEERLLAKGKLCARFQVQLGQKMADHLQAYMKASFALKLLLVRVRVQESLGGKGRQEFVEIVMTPEARALYAEKNPEAADKYRQQLVAADDGEGGLLDAEYEEDAPRLAIADGQLAIEAGGQPQLALTDGDAPAPSTEKKRGRLRRLAAESKEAAPEAAAPPEAAREEQARPAAAAKRGKRDAGAPEKVLCLTDGQASRAQEESNPATAKRLRRDVGAPEKAPTASAGAGPQPPTGTGSVWERCPARALLPGSSGLAEARDALSDNLARKARGGMEAIKAEREAVAWLKGLLEYEVCAEDLTTTRIGLVVNDWRKHPEPYISRLAASLLSAWKRVWREAGQRQAA